MLDVAILGTGKIGLDLLAKVQKSKKLRCVAVAGTRLDSDGALEAASRGVRTFVGALGVLQAYPSVCPHIVFDCTNAEAHAGGNAQFLRDAKVTCVNLTPAIDNSDATIVPAINLDRCCYGRTDISFSLVTCGGQAALPLVHAVHQEMNRDSQGPISPEYIEVVSSIASLSAGPATRANLDEYIAITEDAIGKFTGCTNCKVALILNPADPPVKMQTSIWICGVNVSIERVRRACGKAFQRVQEYCPGYEWAVAPTVMPRTTGDALFMSVRVSGAGDYLPEYAGNLDIITSAAIAVAEARA